MKAAAKMIGWILAGVCLLPLLPIVGLMYAAVYLERA
jgi:hypothetical protein